MYYAQSTLSHLYKIGLTKNSATTLYKTGLIDLLKQLKELLRALSVTLVQNRLVEHSVMPVQNMLAKALCQVYLVVLS